MADTEKICYFNAEQFQHIQPDLVQEHKVEVYQFLAKVYLWMLVGLLVSFTCGYILSMQKEVVTLLQGKPYVPFAVMMFQMSVSDMYHRFKKNMHPWTCTALFVVYSLITGFSFSFAFISCNMESLISLFFVTSMMFILLIVAGFLFKKEIPIIGQASMMGGTGLVMLFMLQSALHLDMLRLGLSAMCLLMIINRTMATAKEIKKTIDKGFGPDEDTQQLAVDWALRMYTGYMGMFHLALHAFGVRRPGPEQP